MKEVSTTRLIMLHFACMVIGKEIAREGMKKERITYTYDYLKFILI